MEMQRALTVDGSASDQRRVCRSCGGSIETIFVDLGMAPLCEDFLTEDRLVDPETFYPQDVRICSTCLLVQLPAYVSAERIFSEYAYFSSYSDSWVAHAERFVSTAVDRAGLGPDSRVVEIASNDGYLLQHVVARGIPALGVEPAVEHRRGRDRTRDPHAQCVLLEGPRDRGPRHLRSGRPDHREQCLRPRA